jgi:hypothetical protein
MKSIDLESQRERYEKRESISRGSSGISFAVGAAALLYRVYLVGKGAPVPADTAAFTNASAGIGATFGIGYLLEARSDRRNIEALEKDILVEQAAPVLTAGAQLEHGQ